MKETAYKTAGVDIDAGDALVERIKPHVRKTLRPGVMGGLGGFGALFDLKREKFKDPLLVSSTDGVGTKLRLAIDSGLHGGIGTDLVAMSVNDIVTMGAEPLFFLDYFACGRLDIDVAEAVIAGIAKGCLESGCALVGGETAEMPGMYAPNDYDLAGFCVGAVERARLIDGARIEAGDVVLGLASSGLHSNGFSLVRRIVADTPGFDLNAPAPFASGQSWAQVLLTPTRLYIRPLLAALALDDDGGAPVIRGLAHITGGGLPENAGRMLPDSLALEVDAMSWPLPPVFSWLARAGNLTADDLARTLNCGIGMVVIVAEKDAGRVKENLRSSGETVFALGRVVARTNGQPDVLLQNRDRAWTIKP